MSDTRGQPTIYVCSFYFPDLAEFVRKELPECSVVNLRASKQENGLVINSEDLSRYGSEVEVLFCDLVVLRGGGSSLFPALKWVQSKGSGVDALTKEFNGEHKPSFRLTRISSNSSLVAEHVITYILALEKQVFHVHQKQQECQWNQQHFSNGRLLEDVRVCIIGFGEVGSKVGYHCKQFGMEVIGVIRHPRDECTCSNADKIVTVDDLVNVLPTVDYICCCLPGTLETSDMITKDILQVCTEKKPVLINVGRGDLIREETLVTAIREGWLGGAVLDVTPREPLPRDSPLWSLPNVFITPHIAGYRKDAKMVQRYVDVFVENYRRYTNNKPLINEVNFERGY